VERKISSKLKDFQIDQLGYSHIEEEKIVKTYLSISSEGNHKVHKLKGIEELKSRVHNKKKERENILVPVNCWEGV
jgi:nucleosome binding factor SPN SPT16 subunit